MNHKRVKEIRKIVEGLGFKKKEFTIDQMKNGHYQVVLKGEKFTFAATPSDRRGDKNQKSEIRKRLRENGLI